MYDANIIKYNMKLDYICTYINTHAHIYNLFQQKSRYILIFKNNIKFMQRSLLKIFIELSVNTFKYNL